MFYLSPYIHYRYSARGNFKIRGRFLDAGTGTHSLKWIKTLDTQGFTAVTADSVFAENTQRDVRKSVHSFVPAHGDMNESSPD